MCKGFIGPIEEAPQEYPEEWSGRCTHNGHKRIYDGDGAATARYADDGTRVWDAPRDWCGKCGRYPTIPDGHDACLGTLGTVLNACCGHGLAEGYIQFSNGVIIRGHFTVEYFEVRERRE